MPVVITACSNRKRVEPNRMLQGASLAKASLAEVAASWLSRVRAARKVFTPDDLYCGRGYVEARATAQTLGADFYVVSAGLGLVRHDARICAYSLSVTGPSQDNVLRRVTDGGRNAIADWWARVSRVSSKRLSVSRAVRGSTGLVMIALPSAYLAMVAGELEGLPPKSLRRLRIFTRAVPASFPEALRQLVMPYDERLDGPDSVMPGTRSDFASRSLRHFASVILVKNPRGGAEAHKRAVRALLGRWRRKSTPVRPRRSDAELIGLIRANWAKAEGRSGRMLRVLRDDLGVACEQSRFIRLFAKAKPRGARALP